MVGLHLVLTIFILIAGPIQIIPWVRKAFPLFHRWTWRIYILIAFAMSISGPFMVWVWGSVGGVTQHISISVNAVLIMVSALFTVKYARAGDLVRHRIWAIRLFLFVNGVWLFKVALQFWLLINDGPFGFDTDTFQGTALTILSISKYSIPFILFELYLMAGKSLNKLLLMCTALVISLFTILLVIGILSAADNIWLPKMNYQS